MTHPNDDWTIGEGKAWLRPRLDEGDHCPLCTQRAQRYHRKLNSSMAYGLIQMYRAHGRDWGHGPSTGKVARVGGELARARYWGLLEESTEKRDDGGRAGWWRITELGEAFIRNRVQLPSHCYVYAQRLLKMDDAELINIRQALGNHFDYDELMRGI